MLKLVCQFCFLRVFWSCFTTRSDVVALKYFSEQPHIVAAPSTPEATHDTATVLFEFPAQAEGDLALRPGETVIVLERMSDEWWRGRVGASEGIFPAAFVQPNYS